MDSGEAPHRRPRLWVASEAPCALLRVGSGGGRQRDRRKTTKRVSENSWQRAVMIIITTMLLCHGVVAEFRVDHPIY